MKRIKDLRSSKDDIEAASPMRLYFDDDCPRLGSGMRYCDIKIGLKWVHITDRANGTKARLSMRQALPIIDGSMRRSSR
jgi:hypothetical protein